MSTRNDNFFDVEAKASDELEKAVAQELNIPDPSPQDAKAILSGLDDDQDDSESSS